MSDNNNSKTNFVKSSEFSEKQGIINNSNMNISERLKGKIGRIRTNQMGMRANYLTHNVITHCI